MKKAVVLPDESPTIHMVSPKGNEWVRCPQYDERRMKICNKKLFRGRPSFEPQEFMCKCGKTTVFQRLT